MLYICREIIKWSRNPIAFILYPWPYSILYGLVLDPQFMYSHEAFCSCPLWWLFGIFFFFCFAAKSDKSRFSKNFKAEFRNNRPIYRSSFPQFFFYPDYIELNKLRSQIIAILVLDSLCCSRRYLLRSHSIAAFTYTHIYTPFIFGKICQLRANNRRIFGSFHSQRIHTHPHTARICTYYWMLSLCACGVFILKTE